MEQNLNLLVAIREAKLRQRSFAELVGASEATVSMVCNGKLNLEKDVMEKWAVILKRQVKELFPKDAA